MSVTSYGHTPTTIPRGVYPTIAAHMSSSGSYHGDMTMVTTPTSNTMNGITSPESNCGDHLNNVLSFFTPF